MARRLVLLLALTVVAVGSWLFMRNSLMNAMLYFPSRSLGATPSAVGLQYQDVEFATEDDEQLHGWWIPTEARLPPLAHVLLFHGNAGNVSDRLLHAQLLSAAGLDTFLFDYRGYGRSTGSPSEEGTYADARAALQALVSQQNVDPERIVYLGESLGGAVAVALAVETPPWGLVLQSTFTSVRAMGRIHYPILPGAIVPDAYPSLDRIGALTCPLLSLHGDQDTIVPLSEGEALHAAATVPKRFELFRGVGHNDLVPMAGHRYGEVIASWLEELGGATAAVER